MLSYDRTDPGLEMKRHKEKFWPGTMFWYKQAKRLSRMETPGLSWFLGGAVMSKLQLALRSYFLRVDVF